MGNETNNPSDGLGSSSSDDLSEYLQAFLDESAEELDSLVEAILLLENDPRNSDALNKAFRMLHSLKGSCGMMGFETVGNFAHVLEDRFESYRSGRAVLDRDTTTLVLTCVDFFRSFIDRLRTGNADEGDPSALLRQLQQLDLRQTSESRTESSEAANRPTAASPTGAARSISGGILITVRFKPGLQLADLKARLIVSRLSSIGEVISCEPPLDDVQSVDDLPLFSLTLVTEHDASEIRKIANIDGVESVEIHGAPAPEIAVPFERDVAPTAASKVDVALHDTPKPESAPNASLVSATSTAVNEQLSQSQTATAIVHESTETKNQVGETLRIDIERLDRLMNLTGELVVANARFAQITAEMSPVFRRNSLFNKSKGVAERLRQRFRLARQQIGDVSDNRWDALFDGLNDELDGLDEQSELWDEGHHHFLKITEAVDQLSLVSKNLQRGVLNTRMVPVGPLLSRFKRVIRDLSVERGKRVQFLIHGEKTELDRRMIDSLGDPLLHLVRNAIDHGLETPEQRRQVGKPEMGTIRLEAAHRGNNVLITVKDDGAGISSQKIRSRIVARGLVSESQAREMTEQQIIDFIWRPGFSTAEHVTDISGRGVGMDIVRNAIADLSGTIDVASALGQGTTFTIRLPLTLAIIRSLLVRFRDGIFSIPIDDVREIVSVPPDKIHAVHRHLTIDVRGELIPLVSMESAFDWSHPWNESDLISGGPQRNLNVVLLQTRSKSLGLCVDDLVGRADIVIKSLTENFVAIRGISGASIMGDGAVCLMLDCAALLELVSERTLAVGSH